MALRTRTAGTDEISRLVPQPDLEKSKRRFAIAALIGLAAVAVPYLWVLWDLWNGSLDPLRTTESTGYASNFYDLQTRAIFHGHLYVANGALDGEAFVHDGHQYTYFGVFPSILRIPILVLTHSLDGRLTAPSMLLAWLVTALFSVLLVWRVRVLWRGPAMLGRSEAAAYGVLLAAIMGGSVLMSLAAAPWVFSEDLAWSVALTVGTMFALLGVMERPSWGRVLTSGGLILAANLTRGTTGYACVIGALLVAAWIGLGHAGPDNRRWFGPALMAGLVPLAVGCLVTYLKFGILFGLPASSQVVYQVFGLNRYGGGSYFNLRYLPSTVLAYFRPGGLRLTTVFPFLTLPSAGPRAVGHVFFFGADRTASAPAAMPLLFLLALWGLISAFRSRVVGRSHLLRIPLVAAIAAGATVMIYGWIENRFLADFLPFFVLAGTAGMVDIWYRLDGHGRLRRLSLIVAAALGVFGIAANVGMAITPQVTWSNGQILRYVRFQKTISDATGHPLEGHVVHGSELPDEAPADELFVSGNCTGLDISLGGGRPPRHSFLQDLLDVGTVWHPLETGPPVLTTFDIALRSGASTGESIPLVTVGARSVVSVQSLGSDEIRFSLQDPFASGTSPPVRVTGSRPYRVAVTADPTFSTVTVSHHGEQLLKGFLSSRGPIEVHTSNFEPGRLSAPIAAFKAPVTPDMSLCRSLR
jgi:hypothetical protein